MYYYKKTYLDTFNNLNITFGYNDNPIEYIEPKIYKNFITIEECDYIMNKARKFLVLSNIMGLEGKKLDEQRLKELKKIRNSEQMWLNKTDPIYQKMMKKLEKIVDKDSSHFESLQVVRYKPGGFYNEHHDACCDDNNVCKNDIKNLGQRLYTFLICLDNNFSGGETRFPNLNKSYRLNRGDGLFFHTHDINHHKCHKNALHAGLPIKDGIKWICNIWVRDRPNNL
jgi:prolyl 4-hydroxylase